MRDASAYRHPLLPAAVRALDCVSLLIGAWLAWQVQIHMPGGRFGRPLLAADMAAVVLYVMFPKRIDRLLLPKLFSSRAQMRYFVPPVLVAILGCVGLLAALGRDWHEIMQVSFVLAIAALASLTLSRLIVLTAIGRKTVRERLNHRLAVVGFGDEAHALAARLSNEHAAGSPYRIDGFYDDAATGTPGVAGSVDDLIRASAERRFNSVIVAGAPGSLGPGGVRELVWRMRGVHADIYVTPNLVDGLDALSLTPGPGGIPLVVLQRRPLSELELLVKTVFDLLASSLILLFLLPILVPVAVAVKLSSPGPVFFRQPRQGLGNGFFIVYKFRTMYADQGDVMSVRQTSRGDPRVTPIGRWLRRLSIDELPQLFNVLRCEMSLVGPRPHAPQTRAGGLLLDDAIAEYIIRHQVKPGITGWAQVNGSRGELVTVGDLARRVELDLEYIRRWSPWFDLRILWLTVFKEVFSRHAF